MPAIPLLPTGPKEMKAFAQMKTCTLFIAAPFRIASLEMTQMSF